MLVCERWVLIFLRSQSLFLIRKTQAELNDVSHTGYSLVSRNNCRGKRVHVGVSPRWSPRWTEFTFTIDRWSSKPNRVRSRRKSGGYFAWESWWCLHSKGVSKEKVLNFEKRAEKLNFSAPKLELATDWMSWNLLQSSFFSALVVLIQLGRSLLDKWSIRAKKSLFCNLLQQLLLCIKRTPQFWVHKWCIS